MKIPKDLEYFFDENGQVLKKYWHIAYPLETWAAYSEFIPSNSLIGFLLNRDYACSYGFEYTKPTL